MSEKLKTKDLITIGILNAIFIVVYFVAGMVMSTTPLTYLLLTSVAAVPAGVVFMLLLAKVPRTGVLTITAIVMGLVFLLTGHWWVMIVIAIAGGVIADIFYSLGNKKSFARMAIAYTLFMIIFTVAAYSPLLLFTDTYVQMMTGHGSKGAEFFLEAVSMLTIPACALILAASAGGGLLGAYFGKMLLQKHFIKAGIV